MISWNSQNGFESRVSLSAYLSFRTPYVSLPPSQEGIFPRLMVSLLPLHPLFCCSRALRYFSFRWNGLVACLRRDNIPLVCTRRYSRRQILRKKDCRQRRRYTTDIAPTVLLCISQNFARPAVRFFNFTDSGDETATLNFHV